MKVAVASTEKGINGGIAGHFGNATHFVIAEIENNEIKSIKLLENPHAGEHVPGALPEFLKEAGADAVIVCGIGPMAIKYFNDYGIKLVMGVEGSVKDILEQYAAGKLEGEENKCSL